MVGQRGMTQEVAGPAFVIAQGVDASDAMGNTFVNVAAAELNEGDMLRWCTQGHLVGRERLMCGLPVG